MTVASIEDRLEEKIDRSGGPDACHPWTGAPQGEGYGTIRWQGKQWLTHRLVWTLENGEIPPGVVIRHRCDNPPCCNRRHLLSGTKADNAADMRERRRSYWKNRTVCAAGHPWTEENTWVNRHGVRKCRKCRRTHENRYRARKRKGLVKAA